MSLLGTGILLGDSKQVLKKGHAMVEKSYEAVRAQYGGLCLGRGSFSGITGDCVQYSLTIV